MTRKKVATGSVKQEVKSKKNDGGNESVVEKCKPVDSKEKGDSAATVPSGLKREKRKRKRMESIKNRENEKDADKSNTQDGPSNKKKKAKQNINKETNGNGCEDVNGKKRGHQGTNLDEPIPKKSKEDEERLVWMKAVESSLSTPSLTELELDFINFYKTFTPCPQTKKGIQKWKAENANALTKYTPVLINKVFNLFRSAYNKLNQKNGATGNEQQNVDGGVKQKKKKKNKKTSRENSATRNTVEKGNGALKQTTAPENVANAQEKVNGVKQKKKKNKQMKQENSAAAGNAQQKGNNVGEQTSTKENIAPGVDAQDNANCLKQKKKKNKKKVTQLEPATANAQEKVNGSDGAVKESADAKTPGVEKQNAAPKNGTNGSEQPEIDGALKQKKKKKNKKMKPENETTANGQQKTNGVQKEGKKV